MEPTRCTSPATISGRNRSSAPCLEMLSALQISLGIMLLLSRSICSNYSRRPSPDWPIFEQPRLECDCAGSTSHRAADLPGSIVAGIPARAYPDAPRIKRRGNGGIGVERFLQAAAIAVWFEKPHELLMGPGLRVGMLDAIQIIKC